jgi:hypothetical protein
MYIFFDLIAILNFISMSTVPKTSRLWRGIGKPVYHSGGAGGRLDPI